jgi:hypothetical protein
VFSAIVLRRLAAPFTLILVLLPFVALFSEIAERPLSILVWPAGAPALTQG